MDKAATLKKVRFPEGTGDSHRVNQLLLCAAND
jgi:hypothetical protein